MSAADRQETYTIGQVAQMTGITVPSLRAWEHRYGFPRPLRLAGNHRRYGAEEVALLRRVAAERASGLSVPAAIGRVVGAVSGPRSVFAAMQSTLPGEAALRVAKPALLRICRALEDEIAWRTAEGVLVGGFQHHRFYEVERPRWEELASTASLALVLAEGLPEPNPGTSPPVTVPLRPAELLKREWFLLSLSPTFAAGLVGWEAPGDRNGSHRHFEVLWSLDATAVTAAMRVVVSLVEDSDAELGRRLRTRIGEIPPAPLDTATVTAVSRRIISYLAGDAGAFSR